jgi:hypothetical protein
VTSNQAHVIIVARKATGKMSAQSHAIWTRNENIDHQEIVLEVVPETALMNAQAAIHREMDPVKDPRCMV